MGALAEGPRWGWEIRGGPGLDLLPTNDLGATLIPISPPCHEKRVLPYPCGVIGWGLVRFLPSADQPQPQRPSSESENRSRNPDARCERLLRYWGDLGFGVDWEAVGTHPHGTLQRPTGHMLGN